MIRMQNEHTTYHQEAATNWEWGENTHPSKIQDEYRIRSNAIYSEDDMKSHIKIADIKFFFALSTV